MYTLIALIDKIKPATPTEELLLKIVRKLCRVVGKEQSNEKLWGPAHQAISECKKELGSER